MNRVKVAIKGIPPKQPEEEAASDKQLGYLRSFQMFSESTIRDLGMWQASYLIDRALKIRNESEVDDQPSVKRKSKNGCGSFMFAGLVAGAILWGVIKFVSSSKEPPSHAPMQRLEAEAQPQYRKPRKPPTSELQEELHRREPAMPTPPMPELSIEGVAPKASPELKELNSFAGLEFPLSVRVIEQVFLLNKAGKETAIPVGSLIKISDRKDLGTLTMDIVGVSYVGNESRLIHKVRLP